MLANKFYRLTKILKTEADYYVIYGERSNGKTYSVLEYCLDKYLRTGAQFVVLRRWDEDIKPKIASHWFDGFVANGAIMKMTNGKYNNVTYTKGRFFLCYDAPKKEDSYVDNSAMGYAISFTMAEHIKSSAFPLVETILFDEFISRNYYLPNEFIEFQNILSSIIRLRDNVKIFMCGNTINKYNPYFKEMGLTHAKNMEKGVIDVYTYGASGLKVAVEYSDFKGSKKPSDKYFAFDNPKLKMITRGSWEIAVYPHCPYKLVPKDFIYKYFIIFDGDVLQCNLIQRNNDTFTFIHRKTTPIKENENELIYTTEYSPKSYYRRKISVCTTELERFIYKQFITDKVFYQDNEVGEIVRNYLMWCGTDSLED